MDWNEINFRIEDRCKDTKYEVENYVDKEISKLQQEIYLLQQKVTELDRKTDHKFV